MIGLVVAAHGKLSVEMVATAEQIVGPLAQVASCSVEPGASAEEIRDQIQDAVMRVDTGDGVVVLADLYGGSPCTASVSLCQKSNLEVVTGINLPMLLKASSLRLEGHSVQTLAQALVLYGQRNISHASAIVRDALRAAAH
jgi:PTS system mannose-specific IIA component